MSTISPVRLAGAAALAFMPMLANAHPGHGAEGLLAGAMHPLTGIDHLLVMLAVGLWAAQLGGRMLWQLPLAFASLLCAGAIGAHVVGATLVPDALEQAIAASVVISGALLAVALRARGIASIALCGGFALLHGYAHGAEAPAGSFAAYSFGFVSGSVALHAVGIAAGLCCARLASQFAVRIGGAAMALCGFAMLVA